MYTSHHTVTHTHYTTQPAQHTVSYMPCTSFSFNEMSQFSHFAPLCVQIRVNMDGDKKQTTPSVAAAHLVLCAHIAAGFQLQCNSIHPNLSTIYYNLQQYQINSGMALQNKLVCYDC